MMITGSTFELVLGTVALGGGLFSALWMIFNKIVWVWDRNLRLLWWATTALLSLVGYMYLFGTGTETELWTRNLLLIIALTSHISMGRLIFKQRKLQSQGILRHCPLFDKDCDDCGCVLPEDSNYQLTVNQRFPLMMVSTSSKESG